MDLLRTIYRLKKDHPDVWSMTPYQTYFADFEMREEKRRDMAMAAQAATVPNGDEEQQNNFYHGINV